MSFAFVCVVLPVVPLSAIEAAMDAYSVIVVLMTCRAAGRRRRLVIIVVIVLGGVVFDVEHRATGRAPFKPVICHVVVFVAVVELVGHLASAVGACHSYLLVSPGIAGRLKRKLDVLHRFQAVDSY